MAEAVTEIDVYADGSFYQAVGIGGWAFQVPSLELRHGGSFEGSDAFTFELAAVVEGLEAVAAQGNGVKNWIHVFSDCARTIAAP